MSKFISPQQFDTVIENIINDEEKQARASKRPFSGIPQEKLMTEINRRIGTDWSLQKEHPLKLTKADINAVANARFYKKTGMRILMLWVIVVLALLQGIQWIPIGSIYFYYVLCGGVTIGFVYYYGKRQRDARKELWSGLEGNGEPEG